MANQFWTYSNYSNLEEIKIKIDISKISFFRLRIHFGRHATVTKCPKWIYYF